LTSQSLIDQIQEAFILPDFEGSDHCPVGLEWDEKP
jgi:exonuclease III